MRSGYASAAAKAMVIESRLDGVRTNFERPALRAWHVPTGWVTFYTHRMGDTFPDRMGDTSRAICHGKQHVKKYNGGNSFRNFYATKSHSWSFRGTGPSAEKQLINGSNGSRSEVDLDWPIGSIWPIGYTTGPALSG